MEDPVIFLLVSIGMFFNKTFHSINQNSVRSFLSTFLDLNLPLSWKRSHCYLNGKIRFIV
ncbi:hypothetical protein Hanom_Chr06g00565221 [Helianthus anomalus]